MKKFVALLLLLFVIPVFGQSATVAQPEAKRPEQVTIPLDKEANLMLQLAITELENLQLKTTLQQERIQAYLKAIAKPGYTIRKGQDGNWEYAKVETK